MPRPSSLLLATLFAGCADRAATTPETADGREIHTLAHEFPDEYTWLVDHGASLSCDEYQQVERGDVLWDKVIAIRDADPDDPGFITKTSLIRVLSSKLLAEYKDAVAALPDSSDAAAIADIRARLHLESALGATDAQAGLARLGLDLRRATLHSTRVAAPPAGCTPPPPPPVVAYAATDECKVDDGSGSDAGTGDAGGSGSDAGGSGSDAGSGGSGDTGSGTTALGAPVTPADAPPVCDSCKVTCDLSIAVDAQGDAAVTSKKDVNKGMHNGNWSSDVNPGDGSDASILPTRWRHYTTAVTCTSTGCGKNTWKANVKPTNFGDGAMSVNIHGDTTNPDFTTDINSSCSVSVNALAQSNITMDKNADDCAGSNKNPSFAHTMEILYAVHTETSTESGSELSGSVGVTYEANQNSTSGANANIKASGTGKDGLTIDGVNIAGQAGQQMNTSWNGKSAASYAFRRSKKVKSDWQAGSTTLAVMDTINGPPSLTLTNDCPQKTVTYKYDLSNFRSDMKWETNTFTRGSSPLCNSRIEANMPALPATIDFTCVYTSSDSTDSKDCKGKLTKP